MPDMLLEMEEALGSGIAPPLPTEEVCSPDWAEQFDQALVSERPADELRKLFVEKAKTLKQKKEVVEAISDIPDVTKKLDVLMAVLRDVSVGVRWACVNAISLLLPNPRAWVALMHASENDESAEVRGWAHDRLKSSAGRFRLGKDLTCVIVLSMSKNPDREQRVDAVADHIRAVATELTNPEEQREAEVKALVGSVPREAEYREQLQAFTGITHVMRVMMARQLEPKLRDHLRNEGPTVEPAADAGDRKSAFADRLTDGLFRLGLGIRWGTSEDVCYLSTGQSKRSPYGFYRVMVCGQPKCVKQPGGWSDRQVIRQSEDVDQHVSFVGLIDAASPGKENHLSPKNSRR